jgi:hypothetical protein
VAAPTAASPPERFEEPFTPNFPDLENDLAVFVNITRDAYCTDDVVAFEEAVIAWIEGGMVDPFPDEPEFPPGFDGIDVQLKETGKGALVAHANADDLVIELWTLDSPENRPFVGPCTDTDDDAEFFARGTTSFKSNDNDLFGSGTRGNAFGDQGRAEVMDGAGNYYDYSWKFHLNSRCYAPEDGPPACLIEAASLEAK